MDNANRRLMWHGALLFLLGLLTGFAESHFANVRLKCDWQERPSRPRFGPHFTALTSTGYSQRWPQFSARERCLLLQLLDSELNLGRKILSPPAL